MGYAVGYEDGRHIGYGVPAPCDFPGCEVEIDRGMGYRCEGKLEFDDVTDEPIKDECCGFYFCLDHRYVDHSTVQPKPDPIGWKLWMLGHESWQEWRDENPSQVAAIREELSKGRNRALAIAYIYRHGDDDEIAEILVAVP